MRIGILDWGIGGMGLLKLLRENTTADIIYFSDAGYTPYGKVHQAELLHRVEKVIRWFRDQKADKIAVACNAASTVIPPDMNITGIIEHGISMVLDEKIKEVVVAGGKRTVESEIYKTALEKAGINVTQTIGQPLSARVEAGDLDSPGLEKDIEMVFEKAKNKKHILLACTHYPVISANIQNFLPQAKLLDPDRQMWNWIKNNWPPLSGNATVQFFTSGDTQNMKNSAEKAFGISIDSIEKIKV